MTDIFCSFTRNVTFVTSFCQSRAELLGSPAYCLIKTLKIQPLIRSVLTSYKISLRHRKSLPIVKAFPRHFFNVDNHQCNYNIAIESQRKNKNEIRTDYCIAGYHTANSEYIIQCYGILIRYSTYRERMQINLTPI